MFAHCLVFNFPLRRRVPKRRLCAGEILTDYILLHSTAHFLQASAHFLQQACAESFLHSAAQALQRSAQSLQSASQNDEPLAANLAPKAQMSAQSRQSAIHFKWFLSFMLMQQVAQSSHSIEQARQASMQFLEFFIVFDYLIFSSVPLLPGFQIRCYPIYHFMLSIRFRSSFLRSLRCGLLFFSYDAHPERRE